MADLFRDDGEDVGESFEVVELGSCQLGGETMENSVVGVDDSSSSSGGGGGGEGRERGIIPVSVSWEDGGFGVVLDLDNEGFLQVL